VFTARGLNQDLSSLAPIALAVITGLAAFSHTAIKIPAIEASRLLRTIDAATAVDRQILAIKVADRLHNMRTVQYLPLDKQPRLATEARDVFVLAARLFRLDAAGSEPEILAFTTLRHNRSARTASGRLLTPWPRCCPRLAKPGSAGTAGRTAHHTRTLQPGPPRAHQLLAIRSWR
jgi:hypothetical protein